MAILIPILSALLLIALVNKGRAARRHSTFNKLSLNDKEKAVAKSKRKQDEVKYYYYFEPSSRSKSY